MKPSPGPQASRPGLAPGGLALAATGFDALFPLAVAIWVPADAPLIFSAGIIAGFGLTTAVYLGLTSPDTIRGAWQFPARLGRQLRRPLFGLMLAGRLNRPLFVVAVALAGATLPTLISGLVPIAYMLMLQQSMESGRYRPIGRRALPPLALALAGVSLVVVSQPTDIGGGGWWLLVAGVAVSLAAVASAALTTLDLVWGVDYNRTAKQAANSRDETAASLLGTLLAAAAVMPGLLTIGLLSSGSQVAGEAFLSGAIIGVITRAPFTILIRRANFETVSLTINMLMFLGPLVSLGLLAVFGQTTNVRLEVAVAGGLAIVAANLVLAGQRAKPDPAG